jgi:FtsP/CotA-like multicopper oxidase with cupredoxin domain
MSSILRSKALRPVLPVLATVAILAPLAWLWQASRVPAAYSVMSMGYLDYGAGTEPNMAQGHDHQAGHHQADHGEQPSRPITELIVNPDRPADVQVDLVARQQPLTIGSRSIAGYSLNGTSPGPEIRATQGQLVEVHLRNESVTAGVTLHWHGLDVPNAMDGVAGVTQDAMPVGGQFVYRFVANQVGSFWYHSHQVSNPQVAGGLFGSLVVMPKSGIAQRLDVSAMAHTYAGARTVNGKAEDLTVPAYV